MNKSELLQWLQEEHKSWVVVVDLFTPSIWNKPGVAGDWSMKDVLAHLVGWNRRLVADMKAVQSGKPKPSPPWPKDLETDDEINAWLYETNKNRSVSELLEDEEHVFDQLLEVVNSFPDVEIETVHYEGHDYYLVHLHDQQLQPGEFFDHYRDDHEAKILSFLDKHIPGIDKMGHKIANTNINYSQAHSHCEVFF